MASVFYQVLLAILFVHYVSEQTEISDINEVFKDLGVLIHNQASVVGEWCGEGRGEWW